MVEGIEDLQILVGIDSDDDGTPNQYYSPSREPQHESGGDDLTGNYG